MNTISDFVEAAGTSSARSRWVFLIMIIFSIVVFTAFLNSRKGNWIGSRLKVVQYAVNNFADVKALSEADDFREKDSHALHTPIERSAKFLQIYNIQEREEAKLWLQGYIQSRQRHIQIVSVPILGLSFDVNDLGFLSGMAFVILLLMLRYSMSREYTNVKLVFKKAKAADCLEDCYQLMSMTQIFTLPPSNEEPHERFWRGPIKALFCLPLLLQLVVAANDFRTAGIGFAFNPLNMGMLIVAHLVALMLLAALTFACLTLLGEIDRLWRGYATEIENGVSASVSD